MNKNLTTIKNLITVIQAIAVVVYLYYWITNQPGGLYEMSMQAIVITTILNIGLTIYQAITIK